MNSKRILLIVFLIGLSLTCYQIMNNKYDPLARYQYATEENRDIILAHMDQEDIDYIIQQKIKPEQFMDYILLDGFDVKNVLYYEVCRKTQNTDLNAIVAFCNKYRKIIPYGDLESLLLSYTYNDIEEFYNGAYMYISDASLVVDPSGIKKTMKDKAVVYKYVPKGLVPIGNEVIPNAPKTKSNSIYVKEEVVEPLKQMCSALQATNNQTCGGLILTSGYISYEEQIELYEQALVKYGFDQFHEYEDYPGQSESQLGYTLTFTIASKGEEEIKESEQVKWLAENAKKYGFVARYPQDKEKETGKKYQPLTLRYVGVEEASKESFDVATYFEE